MNKKLENFKKDIKGKRVAVLGIGISNTHLIKYLARIGTDITAFDRAEGGEIAQSIQSLNGLNIKYCLGPDYLKNLKGFDIIFKTPVIRFDIPEILRERENGALITSEMEVFLKLCPAEIFAVTGSDGKTTTTTLIYNILKNSGYNCWLGGNIGIPLIDKIEQINETDKVVLELSSFQLHTMKKSPHVAVITNISPNHLDVHKSMEEYIQAKENIYRYQETTDKVILNYDNDITRKLAYNAKGEAVYFSRKHVLEKGAFVLNKKIVYKNGPCQEEIIGVDDILLPGLHNLENYLAAICATVGYSNAEAIYNVATSFKGVEHRIEFVREVDGIKFYNDSIGTSPTRTIASIRSFNQKIILIAGGYDKHIPYDEMGEIIAERVKLLILVGQTAPRIAEALKKEIERSGRGKDIPVVMCNTFEETVDVAYNRSSRGDIVLLSPASASFDLFKNFEERGNYFKELVNRL